MRTIIYILQKEFIQIFRNRTIVGIMFVVPIIMFIILVNAATLEMKNIKMYVIDNDLSAISRGLISKFEGSRFFSITEMSFSLKRGEKYLKNDKADIILNIPSGMENNIINGKNEKVQLLVNAINGTDATLINAYATSIILDYNRQLIAENIDISNRMPFKNINVSFSHWYNPQLNYKTYMVPGILVILITIVGLILPGLNLVREKELGTTEQINVTPIKKYQFIIGKLLPFWLIALFELALGLLIGKLLYDIPIIGSISLVFGISAIYLLVVLGTGLFISTMAENQQQLMFFCLFFILIFALMSGIFTPVESMPEWGQWINRINPLAYLMKALRMILLKGSTIYNIRTEAISLSVYGILILSLAVWRYRKTT